MSYYSPGETTRAEKKFVTQLVGKLRKRLPHRVVFGIPALVVVGFLVTASYQPNACAVMIDGKEVAIVKDQAFAEDVLKDTCANISSEQEVFTEKKVVFEKSTTRMQRPCFR